MLAANRPSFAARAVFDACCSGVRDAARRNRLSLNGPKVEAAASDYEAAGAIGAINGILASTYEPYGTATVDDFVWLYDNRLVKSRAARSVYEGIRTGNRGERCALCNARAASTLDHHLPKTVHPIFAVAPDNLLPACRECNTVKLADPTPILNAYFDDLGSGRWLKALLAPGSPAVVEFAIEAQSEWSAGLRARADAHFEILGLAKLYSFEAVRQLAGIRGLLARIHSVGGAAAVQFHLQESSDSWQSAEPNSWQSALYAACADSPWFCAGGFAG